MNRVARYAAPTPIASTHSNHAWGVGRGSLACQQSKANAAATDTANCMKRIGGA